MAGLFIVGVVVSWMAILTPSSANFTLSFTPDSAALLVNETLNLTITARNAADAVPFVLNVSDLGKATLDHYSDTVSDVRNASFLVTGKNPGHVIVNASTSGGWVVFHLTIQYSFEWGTVSDVIGWIYFVAWSVSFYPQIYDNWKRKSVVGLNLDFLALNLVGFFLYSLFNACMFWNAEIQREYQEMYPGSLNPVLINDVVFSFHAFFAVVVTIAQCFIYERGEQTVSVVAKGLLAAFALFLAISAICAGADALSWLLFLQFCSYVKLAITLIKYIPQAYMNFRRKSTVGWSIGNVFLDFTGGVLSMLQMIINSWNFDDWASIFGDPTKFGLGLFSVVFDVFFLVQHYILYRHGDSYDGFPTSVSNSRSELVT